MITKNDCFYLLTDLETKGIDTSEILNKLANTSDVTLDIIKFINTNRTLDLTQFYERLRKNYNAKKSQLYKNIVKEELDNPQDILTTLASLNLQILLFSKQIEDKQMFLRHARFTEINSCLLNYGKTYDLTNCIKLLRLIKTDLKALESMKEKN